MLPQSNSFDEFILELKASVDRHMLPNRSIDYIFSDHSVVPPGACSHPTRPGCCLLPGGRAPLFMQRLSATACRAAGTRTLPNASAGRTQGNDSAVEATSAACSMLHRRLPIAISLHRHVSKALTCTSACSLRWGLDGVWSVYWWVCQQDSYLEATPLPSILPSCLWL